MRPNLRGDLILIALKVVAGGIAAGVLSGLLGVGGGVIMVPILVLLAGATQHEAHATSLGAIVPIAFVGALAFALDDELSLTAAAALALGSLVGAPLGAALMARTGEQRLRGAFGLLMVAVGMVMVLT